jgi:hypothetical protein
MTSPVALRAYHQYTDSDTIAPSRSKRSDRSYGDEDYDPYDTPSSQGKSWGNPTFADSGTDDIHKPSLSYSSKGLGK